MFHVPDVPIKPVGTESMMSPPPSCKAVVVHILFRSEMGTENVAVEELAASARRSVWDCAHAACCAEITAGDDALKDGAG
jgi:hypothetical protein